MPDKIYKLTFLKDDNTEESVEFAAPQGPKGDKGDSGVYIGGDEPTDPNVNIWINPDGETAGGVLYTHQNLTENQKKQALENIGAASAEDVEQLSEEIVFDPARYGLPVLALNGDISAMTKENAVNLAYEYEGRTGTASVKWQGSWSLSYPKKNFTVKFDNAFEAGFGWGVQKKYCMKANFIDHSHARNIVSAKLWGEMVRTRKDTGNSGTATNEEMFNLNAVTGWENRLGSPQPYAFSISDGVVTSNVSQYDAGQVYWLGRSFATGNYTLSFDVKKTFDSADSESSVIVYGIGLGDEFSYNPYGLKISGEWEHVEFALANTVADGYLVLQDMATAGAQFKNISLIKHGFSGLSGLPNGGAIDGFPIVITINGAFQGLYTFNIPKDGWMMGMGGGDQEAILCADYSEACWFRADATLNGDFDLEYVSDEDNAEWVIPSVNRLINACYDSMNNGGGDVDTTVAQYLDWESAIDYFIFKKLLNGVDMGGKNYILTTFDGVKWYFSAYDMDCVYGLDWDGKKYYKAKNDTDVTASGHTVDVLIVRYKKEALKQRYAELRASVMSDDNFATVMTNFIGGIPTPVYMEDAKKWPTIPNTASNNLHQIVDYYCRRAAILDKVFAEL